LIRITGGELRGRRLRVPESARPTTEVARKAAFDILSQRIRGARVLDAAAGSGAYGFEALSRGAREVVFVESDARARSLLAANVAELGVGSRTRIAGESVARYAGRRDAGAFDVVFFDPPWENDAAADLRALLGHLVPGGVLFLERGDDVELSPETPAIQRRRYGRTRFFIYGAGEPPV
jgi:16S rRNA (guanine966-N2)-methyltransferase